MSLADMRTITNMMKHLGIRRETEGISVTLDGRCVFVECTVEVTETKVSEDKKPKPIAAKVRLTPVNKQLHVIFNRTDSRRALVSLSSEVYAEGLPRPFPTILEPATGDAIPTIDIVLREGGDFSKVDLTKVIRLYLID